MYSLTRLIFRLLAGKPLAQLIVGIILIPVGGLLSFAAMASDYIYPYWIIAGIVLAIVGIVLIVRGARALLKPKPSVQQAFFMSQGQYPANGQPQPSYPPYGQPQYPPQAPYGQQPQQNYEQIQYPQQ